MTTQNYHLKQWHAVDYVNCIKVLEPKDSKASRSLPERSNTPGTAYLLYRKTGEFDQLRVFDNKSMPIYDIDYGTHGGKKSLHVHNFINGIRSTAPEVLHPGDELYEKYKNTFKGVV